MKTEEELRAYFDYLDEGEVPVAVTPEVSVRRKVKENWGMILDDEGNRVVDPKVVERMRATRDLGDEIIRDMNSGKIKSHD